MVDPPGGQLVARGETGLPGPHDDDVDLLAHDPTVPRRRPTEVRNADREMPSPTEVTIAHAET